MSHELIDVVHDQKKQSCISMNGFKLKCRNGLQVVWAMLPSMIAFKVEEAELQSTLQEFVP